MTAPPNWQAAIEARLGKVPDRVLAREVGVSYEAVRLLRQERRIPRVLSAGMSNSRRRVLDTFPIDGPILTLAQIAEAAFGSDEAAARGSARPLVAWLVSRGYVEHVRRGEYRRRVSSPELLSQGLLHATKCQVCRTGQQGGGVSLEFSSECETGMKLERALAKGSS